MQWTFLHLRSHSGSHRLPTANITILQIIAWYLPTIRDLYTIILSQYDYLFHKMWARNVITAHHILWASYQICKIAGCAFAGNAGNVFLATDVKGNRFLATPACIMKRAPGTCRDACRDRGENVPGIPGPRATHNFTCLVRGPWSVRALQSVLTDRRISTDCRLFSIKLIIQNIR